MPTVTEVDYPHGLRCMTCDTSLPPGAAYVEQEIGQDWITAVCPECG